MPLGSVKNYNSPVSLAFVTDLFVNGIEVSLTVSSPFSLRPRGAYNVVIDGVSYQLAVVQDPKVSYQGIDFTQKNISTSVVSRSLTAPPVLPTDGDRYIVPQAATGAWSGQDDAIATASVVGPVVTWSFVDPVVNEIAAVQDEFANYVWSSRGWVLLPPITGQELRYWRGAQASLPDDRIYDHSGNAYPYFNLPVYSVIYYVDHPCYASLYVDDVFVGRNLAPQVGINRFTGLSFTRGRHKIEVRVEVEP